MVKKFCIGFCLFMFTQQEYFAMNPQPSEDNQQKSTWQKVNEWVNGDEDNAPSLWPLWFFTDNVHFHLGNFKEWKHGEAYYGLINGIGSFPSFLNFGYMKIGIIDLHFDVLNAVIHFLRNCIRRVATGNDLRDEIATVFFFFDIAIGGTHLLSFKIFNGIKIRLISIGACILFLFNSKDREKIFNPNDIAKSWYYKDCNSFSTAYFVFLPRIEINIPALIKYFKK